MTIRIPYNFKAIGDRIRSLRKANGWSATECAKKIGISRSNFYVIESGIIDNLELETIQKICDTFKVSEYYLLHGSEIDKEAVKEENVFYGIDDITMKTIQIMKGLSEEKKRDVLKYTKEKELIEKIQKKQKKAG